MTGPADRRIDLTFDDNGRVPLLYGPHDVHLARIENQLGVTVISRGNRLTVAGPAPSVEVARTALEALWERTGRGLAVDAAEVDAALAPVLAWSADETELLPYRSQFVVQSRAAGLEPPLDTVWVSLDDKDGFRRSALRARSLGFQGKLCIHPDQVPVVNECFCPTESELAHARRVIDAFEQAQREGLAAIQVDGQFVDYPILYRAQRIVARAQAIDSAARP